MDVRAQVSMVFHLDKCIGCHTCSDGLQEYLDRPQRHRVHVVEQRGDQAGHRATRPSGRIRRSTEGWDGTSGR